MPNDRFKKNTIDITTPPPQKLEQLIGHVSHGADSPYLRMKSICNTMQLSPKVAEMMDDLLSGARGSVLPNIPSDEMDSNSLYVLGALSKPGNADLRHLHVATMSMQSRLLQNLSDMIERVENGKPVPSGAQLLTEVVCTISDTPDLEGAPTRSKILDPERLSSFKKDIAEEKKRYIDSLKAGDEQQSYYKDLVDRVSQYPELLGRQDGALVSPKQPSPITFKP